MLNDTPPMLYSPVAVRVCTRQQQLQSCTLAVSLYMRCLGLSGGSTEPTVSLPPPYTVTDSNFQKISHLQKLPGPMRDLQTSLANQHARLELESDVGSTVCILTQETDNVRQLARTWTDDVDRIVKFHLQSIFIQQMNVTAEEFAQADSPVKQKLSGNSEVDLSYEESKELLTIVYKGEQKRNLADNLVTIVESAQREVNRRKQEKTDTMSFSKAKLQLMMKCEKIQGATEKYPKLEINISEDNECIELKGLEEEIQYGKLLVLETANSIISLHHTWDSDLHKQLLALPTARMTVETQCRERGPDEVIEFTEDGFDVHSFDAEKAELVLTTVIQAVQKRVVRFDANSKNVVTLDEWTLLQSSIVAENDELVVMNETPEALTIVGIGPSVQAAYKLFLEFLEKNGVKQQTLQLPRAMHTLFKPYLHDKANDLNLNQDDFVYDPDNDQIIFSGNRLCREAAEDILRAFQQEITLKLVTFTQPSMKEFLETTIWGRKKEDLAVTAKCLVLHPEELPDIYRETLDTSKKRNVQRNVQSLTSVEGAMALWGHDTDQTQSLFATSMPPSGMKQSRRRIKVSDLQAAASADPGRQYVPVRPRIFLNPMSDIAKEEHHVLVNSSNTALMLKNGQVSRDLLAAGGQEIQEECKTKYPNGIKMGGIAVTKGGKLMCKRLIHCTLPEEKDGGKIQKVVRTAVTKCLEKTEKLKLASIAFPALGTGILKYPAALVVDTLYETVMDYGRQHQDTVISDVFFILHKKDTALTEVFKEHHAKYQQKMRESLSEGPEEDLPPAASLQGVQRYPFFEETKGRVEKILLGLGTEALETAERELLECYHDSVGEVTEKNLQLDQWDDLHKNNLINACRPVHVDVTLNFTLGQLTLKGFKENIGKIPKHVLLKEAENAVKEKQQARMILQQVQWSAIEVEDTGEVLSPYDMMNNFQIEMDYKEGKDRTVIAEIENGVRVSYIIDFTKMEEIPEDVARDNKPHPTIIRQNKIRGLDVPPPREWSSMQSKTLDVKQLKSDSSEYHGVADSFKESLRMPAAKIVKIERVQNLTLYKQYQALKQQIQSEMPKEKICEKTKLWHGTGSDAVDGIINHGFNRSFGNREKSAYGQGAYFATSALYSSRDEYATVDLLEQRHIFMCRVLVGEYAVGQKEMRLPPEKTPGGKRYHSTVDDVENPTIFVTFNDVQAYPEYRIVFKDS